MGEPSFATVRVVNRLAAPCILDGAMAGRRGRDFVDALILLAIVQANLAPLIRDASLQRAYASLDEPPPDELRRPVSINAVAQSLSLPYETTRRRIMKLARAGACEVGEAGVIVPTRELAAPEHMAAMMSVWMQIQKLYYTVRDLGVLSELIEKGEGERWAANSGELPIRAVIRIASDYMLRAVENLTRHFPSLISGIIWFAVLRANTEEMPATERGGASEAVADFVDDAHRIPVRVAEVARRLDAPNETVRRYVVELLQEGLLQRDRGGLIVPAHVLARPGAVQVMRDNYADLQRMFAGFARLGVLAEWDRQTPPIAGAA